MIELQQVEKRFHSFQLCIKKLTLNPGLTLLVGKNGAGKSTLLQLLATAIKPERGVITYAGKKLNDHLALIRSEIGYMPAEIELYSEMTVQQLLRYLGELKGLTDEDIRNEVTALLSHYQLSHVHGVKIGQLSEGNRRRIAIAQAMLGKPAFLFLDEPLNNLDIAEKKRVMTSLYPYAAKRTVIVSTHELGEWGDQCDYILWLDGGEVRFYGGPQAWIDHPYLNVWEGTVNSGEITDWLQNYLVVRVQQLEAGLHHLRLIADNHPDNRFTLAQATLEDAYFMRQG